MLAWFNKCDRQFKKNNNKLMGNVEATWNIFSAAEWTWEMRFYFTVSLNKDQ